MTVQLLTGSQWLSWLPCHTSLITEGEELPRWQMSDLQGGNGVFSMERPWQWS